MCCGGGELAGAGVCVVAAVLVGRSVGWLVGCLGIDSIVASVRCGLKLILKGI